MALKKRTEEQIKELERRAAIMRAFCEGKPIQSRSLKIVQEWKDSPDPSWWWRDYEYRVKVEPRKYHLLFYKDGTFLGLAGSACYVGPNEELIEVVEVLKEGEQS